METQTYHWACEDHNPKSDRLMAFEILLKSYCQYSSGDCSGFTQPGIERIPFPNILQDLVNYAKKQAEEEKKYFLPQSSDFVPNYQCQVYGMAGMPTKAWYDAILGGQTTFLNHLGKFTLRTPYLTQQQIENEGCTKTGRNYTKGNFQISHSLITLNGNVLDSFLHVYDNKNNVTIYSGKCKSINEFRTIMKLLNIK
jgi:hypothetical protein